MRGRSFISCTCPGWAARKTCKHVRQTPMERARDKRIAAKAGKKIAPLLANNPSYDTTEQKAERNSELKQFLNEV